MLFISYYNNCNYIKSGYLTLIIRRCILMKKLIHNQKGSVMIVVALGLAVFMGFAALSIDLGTAYVTKSNLQKAADAAALAGAQLLPNSTNARNNAFNYAAKNGVTSSETTVSTPYQGDATKVEVICTRTVNYTFARVLGLQNVQVHARAVAQNNSKWDGEALPFLNLGDDFTDSPNLVWTKQSPGDMGTIHDFDTIDTGSGLYFELDYENGLTIVQGYSNGLKGLDGSTLKTGVEDILADAVPGQTYYVFSLRAEIIDTLLGGGSIQVTDAQGKTQYRYLGTGGGFKNDDVIPPEDLVLLEVKYVSCDLSNNHNIQFDYVKQYSLTDDDFPTAGLHAGITRLVE
jgi:Flp pilus assembly protein TadG